MVWVLLHEHPLWQQFWEAIQLKKIKINKKKIQETVKGTEEGYGTALGRSPAPFAAAGQLWGYFPNPKFPL